MAETASRLRDLEMPEHYRSYYDALATETERALECAKGAKATHADVSDRIDSPIAVDLADRASKMLGIDVTDRLRELLPDKGKEQTALIIAREIALGEHLPDDADLQTRLELAVRVGLATVTESVTIAPLQGIVDVVIKENRDGTQYLSLSIAGPMRSAGGTESAVTMLIADHVRRAVGLGRYRANSYDDETGRFVEELRLYEREASNFQYKVTDEDIVKVISHLPVELDGVDTDPYEVVNHKGMKRIKTDRVRGGALRVLNDGLIGRSKKLLQRVEEYGIEGWDWLRDLEGATQKNDDDAAASTKRMRDVITGRSVLSMSDTLGGLRLRYGRACNTGFTSVGIHPAVAEILNHTIAVGTQVKMNMPGKGATVAFVDSIETPIVRLKGGDVVRVRDAAHAIEIRRDVENILHLGDILVSFGDFVENNAHMPPSGYVEEYWEAELIHRLGDVAKPILGEGTPTLERALEISRTHGVPLHPAYLYYWDQIEPDDLRLLLAPESRNADRIVYAPECKRVLERLGTPHRVDSDLCILEGDEAGVFGALLFSGSVEVHTNVLEDVSKASGIDVRAKFSTSVGVRVGRPEKAAERKMRPSAHVLFPVGNAGGAVLSISKAAAVSTGFTADLSNRACESCGPSLSLKCPKCSQPTRLARHCPKCGNGIDEDYCERCSRDTISHSNTRFALRDELTQAQKRARVKVRDPFKGIKVAAGPGRIAEPLEKGLLRQSFDLTVFRDGTTRYEATNAPLTHFCPSWIGVSPERLRELGYATDKDGRELVDDDQIVELMIQDVIIPAGAAEYLTRACKYVDAELERLYGMAPYYNVRRVDDLIGHLIIGLAPHTSVGIVTRVIGTTKTHVCLGTPNWHSSKRRDADGDADAIMMLLDVFLNFSREFLSDRIGGLMDAPLLIQPFVLPHEAQSQARNLEVVHSLPLAFFEATLSSPKASEVGCVEIVEARDKTAQYDKYHFTHQTSSLVTSRERSAYSTLGTMHEKLEMQIHNANLINAVDASEIISNVLATHLVPDLIGNLRAYNKQEFRCTQCKEKYRRMPLAQKCTNLVRGEPCGTKLTATITRPSVEKYLKMATRLVEKYDVSDYQRGQIRNMGREIEMVFGKAADQTQLVDYA